MDAKELRALVADEHIVFAPMRGCYTAEEMADCRATILRALDLLAAVEASADETVRRLLACCECEQAPLGPLLGEAAAQLVAQSQRIAQLEAERDSLRKHECDWMQDGDEDSDCWVTGCGKAFSITDGKPSENEFVYCVYCGGKMVEHPFVYEDDPDAANPETKP